MSAVDLGISVTVVNNASAALKSIGSDVKGVGDNAQATSNRLKAIQVVIAGILLEKTLEYGKALIAAASAQQGLTIRMAAFAGGASNAQKVMDDLYTSFAATPFSIDAIAQSWTKLRSVMGSNDATTTIIKSVVNDVAALGGTDENIAAVTQGFQRLFATGTASAREYKGILQQTGLTLGDLATAAGTTSTSLERSLKAGFVSAQQFVNDFVKASQTRFAFFAQNLTSSVGGAVSLVSNTITKDIADIGAKTDLNAHITAIFQNVATAIDQVMGAINEKNIDDFFQWLKNIEPFMVNTVTSLINIAQAVLTVGTTVANLLGQMPPEALEYGMIGYFLLGKKGAVLGALVAGVISSAKTAQQQNASSTFSQRQASAASNISNSPVGSTLSSALDLATFGQGNSILSTGAALVQSLTGVVDTGAKVLISKYAGPKSILSSVLNGGGNAKSTFDLVGSQAQIDKIKAALANMKFGVNTASPSGASSALSDALAEAQRETQQLNDTLKTTQDRIAEISFKNQGDELGAALAQINVQSDGYLKTIDAAIKAEGALKIQTAANLALVQALKVARGEVVAQTDIELQREQALYALQTKSFVAQQQTAQVTNNMAAVMLKINSNPSGANQAFLGTSAGQATISTLQQQAQYLEQISTLTGQIADAQAQLNTVTADPARTAALNGTIASLNNYKDATEQALQATTVQGQLQNQMWQTLSQTLENDVSNGITGLIEGTQTLGGVAKQVFGDMIGMAIKYMLQLVELQIFGQIGSAASTAAIAPQAIAAQALWAPAAIAASIATFGAADGVGTAAYIASMATAAVPFANGGVPGLGGSNGGLTTGPTLFGLAGEKGQEGIMPLTRVGGKLGVHAAGMGNTDHIHFHFNTIDNQTGMEFVMKHVPTIDAAIQQRKRLNRAAH
jgi:tape measure domain-containing protein